MSRIQGQAASGNQEVKLRAESRSKLTQSAYRSGREWRQQAIWVKKLEDHQRAKSEHKPDAIA